MPITPRQSDILNRVRSDGRVMVEELAETFGVTVQTIRRDLTELCDARLLDRIHGGAVLPSGVTNIGYEDRRRLNADAKEAIARACAAEIPDGASLFLNIGTTTEAVANIVYREQLDIARQQIEGGLVFGLSLALGSFVRFENGHPVPRNMGALGLPRLADCPDIVVDFISSDAEPFDPGELGVAVAAPAIGSVNGSSASASVAGFSSGASSSSGPASESAAASNPRRASVLRRPGSRRSPITLRRSPTLRSPTASSARCCASICACVRST